MKSDEHSLLKELQTIPGVGKTVAKDLWNLGIKSIQDLKDKDPELLYVRLCQYQGCKVDRCIDVRFTMHLMMNMTLNY